MTRPTDERVHAAGALLAEAVTGVSHGLHSRAAAVLGPVLQEGVLRPDDFKSAKVGECCNAECCCLPYCGRYLVCCGVPGMHCHATKSTLSSHSLPFLQSQAGGKLGQEAIQARVAAALSVCIEQLAQHTRRGKCGELWQLLLAEVESRLETLVEAQQRQQQAASGAGTDQAGEAAAPATGGKKGRKGGKGGKVAAAAQPSGGVVAGQAAEEAAAEVAAAAASAARGIAMLDQLVEHGRGCRVEAYEPLFRLAARLVKPEFLGSGGGGAQPTAESGDAGEPAGLAPLPHGASAVAADFLHPSLSAQVGAGRALGWLGSKSRPSLHAAQSWTAGSPTRSYLALHAVLTHAHPCLLILPSFPLPPQILRLLLALALAHTKVAGASEGPAALTKAAPAWAPAFARAPPVELMPFMRSLISYPGGADVARPFSQQMLGALGRCLLAGESQCGCDTIKTPPMGGPLLCLPWVSICNCNSDKGLLPARLHACAAAMPRLACELLPNMSLSRPHHRPAGELSEVCWPLLVDVCATLRPGATAGAAGVPIILTASGVGAQLAAFVRGKLSGFDRQAAGDASAAAEAWAALACLPHAAESAVQAAACCAALAAATEPSEEDEEQAAEPGSDSSALLMLHCGALGAQAALLAAAGEESGQRVQAQLLPQALALLVRHPGNYHAVAAAAGVLQAASAAGAQLSLQQLQELLPLLAPNLSAASQPLRRETLRVLCCFSQPAMQPPAGSGECTGQGSGWVAGGQGLQGLHCASVQVYAVGPPCLRLVPEPSIRSTCRLISNVLPTASAAEEPPKDAPPQPCDALQQLLVLESRQQGVDGGRPSGGFSVHLALWSSAAAPRLPNAAAGGWLKHQSAVCSVAHQTSFPLLTYSCGAGPHAQLP